MFRIATIGCIESQPSRSAQYIKKRFADEFVTELLDLRWWKLDTDIIKKIVPLLSLEPSLETLKEIRQVAAS